MQATTLKRIATFTVIGLVLLVAVIAGMRWAKARAEYYSHKSQPAAVVKQPQSQPSYTPPAPAPTTPKSAPSTPAPAPQTTPATPNTQPTAAQVPSTGSADVVLSIMSLSLLVFATAMYLQARRNLTTIR